jgi:PAS domain S-box-containing protein
LSAYYDAGITFHFSISVESEIILKAIQSTFRSSEFNFGVKRFKETFNHVNLNYYSMSFDLNVATHKVKFLCETDNFLCDVLGRSFDVEDVLQYLTINQKKSFFINYHNLASGKINSFNDGIGLVFNKTCYRYVCVAKCVKNESGRVKSIVGYLQDVKHKSISEKDVKKSSNDSSLNLYDYADKLNVCLSKYDTSFNFIFVNKKYSETFNLTVAEALETNVFNLIPKDLHEHYKIRLEMLTIDKPSVTYESPYTKSDGSILWHQWTDTALFNEHGGIDGYISEGVDITALKAVNSELVQALTVKELVENTSLNPLFSIINRKLRNPIHAISGFAQLMCEAESTKEELFEFAQIVKNNSNLLIESMEQIQEVDTIQNQKSENIYKVLNVNDMLISLYEKYWDITNNKNIELAYKLSCNDENANIISDKKKLELLISALLENAINSTENGFVEFGYKITDTYLLCYIHDSGCGMNKEQLNLLCDLNNISSTADTHIGLGYTLLKSIIKNLEGEWHITSTPTKGTKVQFTIPVSKPISKENQSHKSVPYKVLVAEDDSGNFKLLEHLLKQFECELLYAENGAQAVKLCKQNQDIKLVLMDINMPIMNGVDAMREIRKFRPSLPIIAQSGFILGSKNDLIENEGFNAVLSKPYSKDEVYEALDKFILSS